MTSFGKLPLETRYNLDLEPVPWAQPEPLSFAGLEALAAKWFTSRPDRLECHPAVYCALLASAPPPSATYSWFASGGEQIWGIAIVRNPELAPGEWRLLCGDEQIDTGTIAP